MRTTRRARRAGVALALGVVVLAGGCATLFGPRQKPATEDPRWVVWPEDEAVLIKNPHEFRGKPMCQACHDKRTGLLATGAIATCTRCHDFRHGNHPVDVVQKTPAKDLPLLPGGKVACHTCHDPHDLKKFRWGLRDGYDKLCLRCHVKH